jgi:hypothetical protein
VSDRLPVGDLAEPPAGPWTCPRCGRENKASWRQCPACETDRTGRTPTQRAPQVQRPRSNPVYVLIGLLVLAALVVAAVVVAEPVWEFVSEQWNTFIGWVDERT